MLYEDNYLAHYGIKGQKWGLRRFQNEDGTLTAEGRARYLKNMSEKERKIYENMSDGQRRYVEKMMDQGHDFQTANQRLTQRRNTRASIIAAGTAVAATAGAMWLTKNASKIKRIALAEVNMLRAYREGAKYLANLRVRIR